MSIKRVRYREGQKLTSEDLKLEQSYRTEMRRRHNIAHHLWGIVSGLKIEAEGANLYVKQGMAIDGFGRELIVNERMPLPTQICDPPKDIFDALDSDTIDVWLLYGREPETPLQRGRWDCGPGKHSRWQEVARLHLTKANTINPRRPVGVSETDLKFGPHKMPPDDQQNEWPVFLGQIIRNQDTAQPYSVSLANRPYVGLKGETVIAPSCRTEVQVGSEKAGDHRRFVVSLPDDTGTLLDHFIVDRDGNILVKGDITSDKVFTLGSSFLLNANDFKDPEGLVLKLKNAQQNTLSKYLTENLSDDTNGLMDAYDGSDPVDRQLLDGLIADLNMLIRYKSLYDKTSIEHVVLRPETRRLIDQDPQDTAVISLLNRLLLEDSYPKEIVKSFADKLMTWGVEFVPMDEVPTKAAPWQVYHTIKAEDNLPSAHQLRFEIGHPGEEGDPSRYRLVIGKRKDIDENGKDNFEPCLTITSDCKIIAKGNIKIVDGQLIQGPIQPDPDDEDFVEQMGKRWLQGLFTALETMLDLNEPRPR